MVTKRIGIALLSILAWSRSAAADEPGATAPPPDTINRTYDTQPVRSLPVGAWKELGAQCRILTTFASSGEGCELAFRTGDTAYFHLDSGFFSTPAFERYMRYVTEGASSSSSASSSSTASTTVIDSARASVYYLALGPGVALWPTRKIGVRIEGGGFLGVVSSPASLVMPATSSLGLGLGLFAGVSVSYRIPSQPFAVSFDYRFQSIPYGGVGSGEDVDVEGVEIGHKLFGIGQSFGLSLAWRWEHERAD